MLGGSVMRYVEQDPPNRVLDFTRFRVQPMDAEAFKRATPGEAFEADLLVTGRCQMDTGEILENVRATASFSSTRSSDTVSLVLGGWLPPTLDAGDDRVCILDKCAVARILTRFDSTRGPSRRERGPDFLDFFEGSPVRLNLILSALEGYDRRVPNRDEIRHNLMKEVTEIRAALPKARIVPDLASAISAAEGLAKDRARVFARQRHFLLTVGPLLRSDVGARRREMVVSKIIAAAANAGIDPRHPLFIATLGCAYPKSRPLCRDVVKFKEDFNEKDAYNAVCDIGNLAILIGLQAIFPSEQMAFYTADRGLAGFWLGLRVANPRLKGRDGYDAQMSPTSDVLDDDAWDRWAELTGTAIT